MSKDNRSKNRQLDRRFAEGLLDEDDYLDSLEKEERKHLKKIKIRDEKENDMHSQE